MAILIYPDGRTTAILPREGATIPYSERCALVPGYNEAIFVNERRLMLVNSKGVMCGKEYNERATSLYRELTGDCRRMLFGAVLLCDPSEVTAPATDKEPDVETEMERIEVAKIRMERLPFMQF